MAPPPPRFNSNGVMPIMDPFYPGAVHITEHPVYQAIYLSAHREAQQHLRTLQRTSRLHDLTSLDMPHLYLYSDNLRDRLRDTHVKLHLAQPFHLVPMTPSGTLAAYHEAIIMFPRLTDNKQQLHVLLQPES